MWWKKKRQWEKRRCMNTIVNIGDLWIEFILLFFTIHNLLLLLSPWGICHYYDFLALSINIVTIVEHHRPSPLLDTLHSHRCHCMTLNNYIPSTLATNDLHHPSLQSPSHYFINIDPPQVENPPPPPPLV